MYLGHKYQQQLTRLTSRLTLVLNKEISLYFFDTIELDGDNLQGFTISTDCKLPSIEVIEEMIKDLECININKYDSNMARSSEILFVICPSTKVLNKWYKMKWDGMIANKVCRKFDFFRLQHSQDEISAFREEMEEKYKDQLIQV